MVEFSLLAVSIRASPVCIMNVEEMYSRCILMSRWFGVNQ